MSETLPCITGSSESWPSADLTDASQEEHTELRQPLGGLKPVLWSWDEPAHEAPAPLRPFSIREGLRRLCATESDSPAIADEQALATLCTKKEYPPTAAPARNVKPALAGLGVQWEGDHRLGYFGAPLEA